MDFVVAALVLLVIFLRPFLDEFWTILQILKSFFVPPRNLKKEYGSWAVVTGCTNGIGKAIAFELAQKGVNIVLIGRSLEKLRSVASDLERDHFVSTKIIQADFSRGREIYRDVEEKLGDVEVGILVNNVGIQYSYPMFFGELPEEEIWALLNTNIGSMMQMTRMLLPKMVERGRGAVVNLSSGSKLQPIPFMNMYAASKVYADFYTQALRHEYRHTNLTIQSLCPYYVNTKINHFSEELRKSNLFIPSAETYARHAISTLGIIDDTTGYWPHRFQYLLFSISPTWVKTYIAGLMYKGMRDKYLRTHPGE